MFKKSKPDAMEKRDLAAFLDFRRRWDDGTLTDDHPVVATTTKWAQKVAYEFKCPDRVEDLRQNALIRLAESNYRGESALDKYIVRILMHANIAERRKSGGKERIEFPAEMADTESQKLFENVLRRISSDKLMNELLAGRPELQQVIVMIVMNSEERIGFRGLAEIASRQLGRKVTRYEIEVAVTQLRKAVTHRSGSHEAIEEWLQVAAQIRQELEGRTHSNSTELAAEDRQR